MLRAMTMKGASPKLWEGPRWTFRAVGGAAALTAAVFIALPYLESLAVRVRPTVRTVPVEHLVVALPPPPLAPEVRAEPESDSPRVPTPTLESPPRPLALPVASLDLTPSLEGVRPAFQMDFSILDEVELLGQLQIFEIHEVDQPPVPLVRLEPRYPREALRRRVEGEVIVEFVVDESGRCSAIEVISSRPGRLFESSAVRAIEGWRFSPGTSNGKPVAVRVRQRVAFAAP
jgi:protein TonB